MVSSSDWTGLYSTDNAQSAYSILHDKISTIITNVFPYKEIKSGYKTKIPWLTPGMKKSISNKHKLYTSYRKSRTPESFQKYKTFRNSLNHVLRTSERRHYQEALQLSKNNLKKSWQLIKEVINKKKKQSVNPTHFTINGNTIDDPSLISDHFNQYFTNIGPVLDNKNLAF